MFSPTDPSHQNFYRVLDWSFDSKTEQLAGPLKTVRLKPLHIKLLTHFLANPNITLSTTELKKRVWKQEFLTDSAVKKAISELRQQIRHVSNIEQDIISNTVNQGYQFRIKPTVVDLKKKQRFYKALVYCIIICSCVALFLLNNAHLDMESSTPHAKYPLQRNAAPVVPIEGEALSLYLRGKSVYYRNGDTALAEQLLRESIKLQPSNNPAYGALLDIYGLQIRSTKLLLRSNAQIAVANQLIKKISSDITMQPMDNLVAMAKYYLVNEGDLSKAQQLFDDSEHDFTQAYDSHVYAFTLALSENKKLSQYTMLLAEQRFPERNASLWYKSMISWINGDAEQAMQEAQWAQRFAANWYPLVFIGVHLHNQQQDDAWQYLVRRYNPISY